MERCELLLLLLLLLFFLRGFRGAPVSRADADSKAGSRRSSLLRCAAMTPLTISQYAETVPSSHATRTPFNAGLSIRVWGLRNPRSGAGATESPPVYQTCLSKRDF